jgi:hypothetical protein
LEQLAEAIEKNGECSIILNTLGNNTKVSKGFNSRMDNAISRISKAKWRKTGSGYSIETK